MTDRLPRGAPLGAPLPHSRDAVSVSLPTWADVIDYERGDPAVVGALQCGYPRFVLHPDVRRLCAAASERHGGERCLVFPSPAAAERNAQLVGRHGGAAWSRDWPEVGLGILFHDEAAAPLAAAFWQHCGEIVSSRRARAALARLYSGAPGGADGSDAKRRVRDSIASMTGQASSDVLLFPTGMAALFHLIRSLARRDPGRRTVQLGFPYVDTLKLQEKIGAGVLFLPQGDGDDVERLAAALESERFAALLCEIPTNPLLRSPPLARVSRLVRSRDVPLIVDDTIGSFANLDLIPFADVLVASLTKLFSGHGDVMGGAIVLNAASPFHGALAQQLAAEQEDLVWAEDAIALAENHRGFGARTARINRTAEELSDYLAAHPAVERVFYPKLETPESYRACMKPGGGYGGLLSILLKDAPRTAPTFFDALDVCKGPGFGTRFTLAAPYTLLAHYRELEWAEACGIPRDLVRVSVGLEEAGDLRDRFSRALERATSGAARRTEPRRRQVAHGGQS